MAVNEEREILQHFEAIPWCKKLLSDDRYQVTPIVSRKPKLSTEDSLGAETFKTDRTIVAFLSMYKKPHGEVAEGNLVIEEARALITLGDGVNGYPHVCHGGMVCFILDEASGILITLNNELSLDRVKPSTVTASLNVRFRQPIKTPGSYLVTARFKDSSARKKIIEATVQDEKSMVLAQGDAVWIVLGGPKNEKL